MTRSLQLKPGSPFLPSPHQQLAKPRKGPIARSLNFKLGLLFLHRTI